MHSRTPEDDLVALRDDLMAYTGAEEAEAHDVLAMVAAWWRFPVDRLSRIVRALAGTLVAAPVAVLWCYWTAMLARTANGGELILLAALRVAAARGISAEYVARLLAMQTPPPDEPWQ